MSGRELSESAESSGDEGSSASMPEAVDRRRSCASTASPPEARPATPETAAPENEVRGSMEPGGGEPSAQPSTGTSRGRAVTRPIFQPQQCPLCDRPTVYITRSGLSYHATVHHVHWYSAKLDRYIPIPEEDLEAKRRLIKDGQAHRKFRVDPVDRDRANLALQCMLHIRWEVCDVRINQESVKLWDRLCRRRLVSVGSDLPRRRRGV